MAETRPDGDPLFREGFVSLFGIRLGSVLDTTARDLRARRSIDGSNYSYEKSLSSSYVPFRNAEIGKTPDTNVIVSIKSTVVLKSQDECLSVSEQLHLRMDANLHLATVRKPIIPGWSSFDAKSGDVELSLVCEGSSLLISLTDTRRMFQAIVDSARKSAPSFAQPGSTSAPIARPPAVEAPATSSPTDTAAMTASRYLHLVQIRIDGAVRYPARSLADGEEGVAEVEIRFTRFGKILNAKLIKSTGHPLLDQEATAAVLRAGDLPRLPESLYPGASEISVKFPMTFSIQ